MKAYLLAGAIEVVFGNPLGTLLIVDVWTLLREGKLDRGLLLYGGAIRADSLDGIVELDAL